jgi:hypothetical protein
VRITRTPAVVAGWRRELPAELADDPTAEQVDAWLELAELIGDGDFRTMISSGAGGHGFEFGLTIRPQVVAHAGGAVERGVGPDSTEGRQTLDRIVPSDLSAVEVDALVTWLETVTDPRIERYWQLLSVLNATAPGASAAPAFAWLLAATRVDL